MRVICNWISTHRAYKGPQTTVIIIIIIIIILIISVV